MNPITISSTINSSYIFTDTTLSTSTINFSTDMAYLVLRHAYTDATIGQTFQLEIQLSSSDSVTQAAYESIPPVLIHVIDGSDLIGNPEGKQPVVN